MHSNLLKICKILFKKKNSTFCQIYTQGAKITWFSSNIYFTEQKFIWNSKLQWITQAGVPTPSPSSWDSESLCPHVLSPATKTGEVLVLSYVLQSCHWLLCCFSCWVVSFVSPWTVAHQTPWSMGFPRQDYEWAAISFSRGSSWPRDWTCISCTAGGFFTIWATWEGPATDQERLWELTTTFATRW